MKTTINLLDGVAVTEDIQEKGLQRGNVGTVVEILDDRNYEVEFVDENGKTYAVLPLSSNKLIVLHYHPPALARAI